MDKIKWGIIGAGGISGKFADAINKLDDAELVAVASRNQESADRFGDRYNIPKRYAGYDALVNDNTVDAVYIGTIHPTHYNSAILCLEHRKAVLCEKPLTMNAVEADEVIAVARQQKVFLMEAMWTRFLPAIVKMREWIEAGRIGEPRHLVADFGFNTPYDPDHRLFDPAKGGGALLDVGIYPVSFASMIFNDIPASIYATVRMAPSGVDSEVAMLFGYTEHRTAVLSCATTLDMVQDAVVNGTEGRIRVHNPFYAAETVSLWEGGNKLEEITLPHEQGNGFIHQARHVGECLRQGLTESPVMPLDESLAIMGTIDAVMASWSG